MFRRLQKILVNFMTSPLIAPIVGAILSMQCLCLATINNDSTFIARAGGLIAMIGLFPTTRRFLRKGVDATIRDLLVVDGGQLEDEKAQLIEYQEVIKDVNAARIGFWLMFIGTCVWAVGDLFYKSIKG
jgi:hypothetical protein